jgi:putative aldouronate transport system permease protein
MGRAQAASVSRLSLWQRMVQHRSLYLLVLPGVLYFVVIKILPIWGLSLAFAEYNPFQGLWKSTWVGTKYFKDLFSSEQFWLMTRNTMVINLMSLFLYFPLPIVLSLLLNELYHSSFKRIAQSIIYLPHFMSWVVIVSLTLFFFSLDIGLLTKILIEVGIEPVPIISDPNLFWFLITGQVIWREMGWGTIIILAAIAGVDPQLYEAATLDGASRWRQTLHVTLPGIAPTVVVLLILRLGRMADVSLEQILLMQNPILYSVSEVYDTYAFTQGILRGQTSIGVSVGLFKSVLNMALVLASNALIKKSGQEGVL